MTTLGIGFHPFTTNAAQAMADAAQRAGIDWRRIDVPSLRVRITDGEPFVADDAGAVAVTHLTPVLLYWQAAASHAYVACEQQGVGVLNPVAAIEAADDKARTAVVLAAHDVPQVETWTSGLDLATCLPVAREVGFPLVVKRTHGAQGSWVRLVPDEAALAGTVDEFAAEGRGALVLQRFVEESRGRSVRVICIEGEAVAATERLAPSGELASNIGRGGAQRSTALCVKEAALAADAARALGLGLAGVDMLRTRVGPRVLEVNAYPDFTSMLPHVEADLPALVVEACLRTSGDA